MKKSLNNIEWKSVHGYEGIYMVSNFGTVKRCLEIKANTERILKPINNGNDYLCVSLCLNSKKKRFYIHRLVAYAFLENNEKKDEVNHIDGNRKNNKLSNLEWVTRSENHFHRYKVLNQKGVNFGKTGEKNWNSKKVGCFDENMNLIKEYHGVMDAARIIGVDESSIRSAIYKKHNCKGLKWNYL